VAAAHLKLPGYDRSKVDGIWLPCRSIRTVAARLLAMPAEARARHPCIGRERAELIMAGVAILDAVLDVWPVEQIRVGDRGLREGAIYGMAEPHAPAGGWRA
jgi:exopolyphosphatase/guanosine-5'-triphosphate,3'-diphosphate pyrophosphatase